MDKYQAFKASQNGETKVLGIISNSTVWLNSFNLLGGKIVLNSKGKIGDYAFCLVQIPDSTDNITVTVNGKIPVEKNRGKFKISPLSTSYIFMNLCRIQ